MRRDECLSTRKRTTVTLLTSFQFAPQVQIGAIDCFSPGKANTPPAVYTASTCGISSIAPRLRHRRTRDEPLAVHRYRHTQYPRGGRLDGLDQVLSL